jgi:hypothetical protein
MLALTFFSMTEMIGDENSLAFVAIHIPLKSGRFAGMTFWKTAPEMFLTVALSPWQVHPPDLQPAAVVGPADTFGFGLAVTARRNVPSLR